MISSLEEKYIQAGAWSVKEEGRGREKGGGGGEKGKEYERDIERKGGRRGNLFWEGGGGRGKRGCLTKGEERGECLGKRGKGRN